MTEQCGPQGLDDPLRVGLLDGELRGEVAGRDDLGEPGLEVALAHPAHDGVDEPGRPGAVHLAREAHRLVDGRVGRDAHPEELVGAEPQRVEDVRVDLVQGPPRGDTDDRVVEAVHPHRAVDELGRERGVTTLDAAVAQHPRELEVGVGTVRDGPQDGVGREPLRVAAAGALARALRRALPAPVGALGSLAPLGIAPTPLVVPARAAWSLLTHR